MSEIEISDKRLFNISKNDTVTPEYNEIYEQERVNFVNKGNKVYDSEENPD